MSPSQRQPSDAPRAPPHLPGPDRDALPAIEVGRYRDFLPLGQGGMGVVYRALDTLLGREVAFKLHRLAGPGAAGVTPSDPLAPRIAGVGPDEVAAAGRELLALRFVHEASLTAGLEHPGIAPVYDLGRTPSGLPYYTMRFVPGGRTLGDALGGDVALASDELLGTFERLLEAVAYAHASHVVHRDLKPDNIALGRFGEVVVLDWGLAVVMDDPQGPSDDWCTRLSERRVAAGLATHAGLLGTPGFVPPEHLRPGGARVKPTGDVFALGVTLYLGLSGRHPWPPDGPDAYARSVLAAEPVPLSTCAPRVQAGLAVLCMRALERDPARRFADAGEMLRALRSWRVEAARERVVESSLALASGAVAAAAALAPALREPALEQAGEALARLEQDAHVAGPHAGRADALRERLRSLREEGVRARLAEARGRSLRRAAVVGLLLLAAVAVGTGVALEARRQETEQARLAARAGHERAEATIRFLLTDLRDRLEPVGRLDMLGVVAERALAHYRTAPTTTDLRERAQRSLAMRMLGEVFQARGDLPRALDAFREAGRVAAEGDPGGERSRELDVALALAGMRVASVRDLQGHPSEAMSGYREHVAALDDLEARHGPALDLAEARIRVGLALARALVRSGDPAQAAELAQRARTQARVLADASPRDTRLEEAALQALLDESHILHVVHRGREALAQVGDALSRIEARMQREPADQRWPRLAADAWSRMLPPLGEAGDLAAARHAYDRAQAVIHRGCAADPADERWRERGVVLAARWAEVLRLGQRYDEMLGVAEAALLEAERLAAADRSSGQRLHLVVDAADRVAQAHRGRGEIEPTRVARERAAEASERLLERDPDNVTWRLIAGLNLRRCAELCMSEALPRALDMLGRAEALLSSLVGEGRADPVTEVDAWETRMCLGIARCQAGERGAGLDDLRAAGRGLEQLAARRVGDSRVGAACVRRAIELMLVLDPRDPAEGEEAGALAGMARTWLEQGRAGPAGSPHVEHLAKRLEDAVAASRRPASDSPR